MTSIPTQPAGQNLTIALIVASIRPQRSADLLLPWLNERLDAEPLLEIDRIDLRELLANGDLDPRTIRPGAEPTSTGRRLDAADGYLIVVPEYNHSFPGALKDLIDLHYTPWTHKPVGFVSYGAASGGIRAVEQLRLIVPELRAMTTRDVVTVVAPWSRGASFVPTEGENGALTATLADLTWWARALKAARTADRD